MFRILFLYYRRTPQSHEFDCGGRFTETRLQTHHRGQATTLLSQAGVDTGVTDLLELIADA